MLILGIESSCDETAVALVESGTKVIYSLVASQVDVHAVFGGIVPEIAAREHLRAIDPLFHKVMSESGVAIDSVNGIAVTQGPGLIGALLVGIAYAKGLALSLKKPLIPVDHVEAHIHSAFLSDDWTQDKIRGNFPAIALVASGGHTNLYYMKSPIQFKLLAYSQDDACGECFDKTAKLLGLKYPGGSEIEKLAQQGDSSAVAMPKVVSPKSKMMFSYSGLKTHMVHQIAAYRRSIENQEGPLNLENTYIYNLCAAFQSEAFAQLVRKIKNAVDDYPESRSVIIAGGVAANKKLRGMLADTLGLPLVFPQLKFCSDNAAMIAGLAYRMFHTTDKESMKGDFFKQDWDAYSRYRFE